MREHIENYIDHESRIRVQEQLSQRIEEKLNHLDNKLDGQFKWIIGILVTLILAIIFTK